MRTDSQSTVVEVLKSGAILTYSIQGWRYRPDHMFVCMPLLFEERVNDFIYLAVPEEVRADLGYHASVAGEHVGVEVEIDHLDLRPWTLTTRAGESIGILASGVSVDSGMLRFWVIERLGDLWRQMEMVTIAERDVATFAWDPDNSFGLGPVEETVNWQPMQDLFAEHGMSADGWLRLEGSPFPPEPPVGWPPPEPPEEEWDPADGDPDEIVDDWTPPEIPAIQIVDFASFPLLPQGRPVHVRYQGQRYDYDAERQGFVDIPEDLADHLARHTWHLTPPAGV